MPGQVVQKLNLGALPPGFTFSITKITASAPPPKAWKVAIALANGTVVTNTDKTPPKFPIAVRPGLIGTVKFDGYNSVSSSGPGGQVYMTFKFEGSVTSEGRTIKIADSGTIQVTTTEWKGTARPDFTHITYSTTKNPTRDPTVLKKSVQPNKQPDDANFSIVKTANGIWSLQPSSHFED